MSVSELNNRPKTSRQSLQVAILAVLTLIVAGCGGSMGVPPIDAVVPAPTKMVIQPKTVVTRQISPPFVNQSIAIRGNVLYVGRDARNGPAVWEGSQDFPLTTNLVAPEIDCANLHYAIGDYYESGERNPCFIWRYRDNGPVITLPNCIGLAVAKNADVFFDEEQDFTTYKSTLYLLTVQGDLVKRVPYKLGKLGGADPVGIVAITKSGVTLARDGILTGSGSGQRLMMRAQASRLDRPVPQTPNSKSTVSTSPTQSGYCLLSTTSDPVELYSPVGVNGVFVYSVNDSGISVGWSFTYGGPDGLTEQPLYWDAKGNPHSLSLPPSATQGQAWDINNSGTVVGSLQNSTGDYGAMWPTVSGTPVNVNSLLTNFNYYVMCVESIGDDASMFALCQPGPTLSADYYYLGLQPAR